MFSCSCLQKIAKKYVNFYSELAWQNQKLALCITGQMVCDLITKNDVAGNIIEFYMLKLKNRMFKQERKEDGELKYKSQAVFLSTLAFVSVSFIE